MTILIVVNYGSFNQDTLLTDLAYDVAITVRTAQTYGLSVRCAASGACGNFQYPYGVHFSTDGSTKDTHPPLNYLNQEIVLFTDSSPMNGDGTYGDGKYTSTVDSMQTIYTLKRGAVIAGVCAVNGVTCTPGAGSLDISFRRPDPTAIIKYSVDNFSATYSYAQIKVKGSDGGTRTISVYSNGQISVNP
jgi:hypothetical protein